MPTDVYPVQKVDLYRCGRRWMVWRRWTGIEPAYEGSPRTPALKAGEPTRRSDTSTSDYMADCRPNGGQSSQIDSHRRQCGRRAGLEPTARYAGAVEDIVVPSRLDAAPEIAVAFSDGRVAGFRVAR